MPGTFNRTLNNFTKNKYALVLSNFPNLSSIPDSEIDMSAFDTKVQSLELPNMTLPILHSYWQHEDQKHPNPVGARDSNTLSIEWILDDKLMNYFLFYSWIKGSRYGKAARDDLLRDNCIDRIDVYALDNALFPSAKISFFRVFLTGLGSLPLQFGDASVVTFNTTFEYEQFGVTAQGKNEDGSWKIEPLRAAT